MDNNQRRVLFARLERRRHQAGISVRQLTEEAGYSMGAYYQQKNRSRCPKAQTLIDLWEALERLLVAQRDQKILFFLLDKYRRRAGISVSVLTEYAGYSKENYYLCLKHSRCPKAQTVRDLWDALNQLTGGEIR